MAKCVCCGCVTDDDCCVSGYYFDGGTGASGCPAGLNGPYPTAAACSAAVSACHVSGPIPICFCPDIDNECCEDGVCRSVCEELPP